MKTFLIFGAPIILAIATSFVNAEMNRTEKPAIKLFLFFTTVTCASCTNAVYYAATNWRQINGYNPLAKITIFLAALASLFIGLMCLKIYEHVWNSRRR